VAIGGYHIMLVNGMQESVLANTEKFFWFLGLPRWPAKGENDEQHKDEG
jgi:hypothetical protein